MATKRSKAIGSLVLLHYRGRKRDLPWRRQRDPYAIWISEIMLQQTRVAAVIPYYERWLKSFPDAKSLAAADLDEVLSHWSGLGYYSRARNIHKCARTLATDRDGELPKDVPSLLKLPGIGRYTAGAISSIAFGQPEPLVDGNVARLIARVYGIEDSIKSTPVIKKLWAICTALVPKQSPGDFNQGLMELGALTCLPKHPKCAECPLQPHCLAHKFQRTGDIPKVEKRQAAKDKPLLATDALFVVQNDALLLAHNPPTGLYGGLWELPQAAMRDELSGLTGLALEFRDEAPSMVHQQVLTHRRLRIAVWTAQGSGRIKLQSDSKYQRLAWHSWDAIGRLGISTASKAILEYGPHK